MTQAIVGNQTEALQAAIALTRSATSHAQAHEAFDELKTALDNKADPETIQMLELLWQALVSAQRSVTFWQEISQVEKNLSDRITENHIQLKQNYMRLMQEQ